MDLGGYFFWLGASADADPALVASDQVASRLAPAGVDPLRCPHHWVWWRDVATNRGFQLCAYCGDER